MPHQHYFVNLTYNMYFDVHYMEYVIGKLNMLSHTVSWLLREWCSLHSLPGSVVQDKNQPANQRWKEGQHHASCSGWAEHDRGRSGVCRRRRGHGEQWQWHCWYCGGRSWRRFERNQGEENIKAWTSSERFV